MSEIDTYLDEGMYLPTAFRDFHDGKDLFKAMSPMLEHYKKRKESQWLPDVSWSHLQCYSIDVFLVFLAMHGYAVQRIPKKQREKLGCLELENTIKEHREMLLSIMTANLFENMGNKRQSVGED